MPPFPLVLSAIALQFVAQGLGGGWGAAMGGVLVGIVLRQGGAFRTGFLTALAAAAMLLMIQAVRGAPLLAFADRLGGNFSLPGWALLLVTVMLPALQAAGFAGGVARLSAPKPAD